MVNIEGISKAKVLAALYNGAKPQGMGFLHYDPQPMSEEEAGEILKHYQYFDYLKGRVMKVDLKGDKEFDERWYDRDNGRGASETVVRQVRESGTVEGGFINALHTIGKLDGAAEALELAETPSVVDDSGGIKTFRLGGKGVEKELKEGIDRALGKVEE